MSQNKEGTFCFELLLGDAGWVAVLLHTNQKIKESQFSGKDKKQKWREDSNKQSPRLELVLSEARLHPQPWVSGGTPEC